MPNNLEGGRAEQEVADVVTLAAEHDRVRGHGLGDHLRGRRGRRRVGRERDEIRTVPEGALTMEPMDMGIDQQERPGIAEVRGRCTSGLLDPLDDSVMVHALAEAGSLMPQRLTIELSTTSKIVTPRIDTSLPVAATPSNSPVCLPPPVSQVITSIHAGAEQRHGLFE